MSKNDPDSNKRQQRAAACWALTIFLVTIAVSASISFASNEVMARSSMAVAFLILLVIVAVGILFDIIGVAVTSADEKWWAISAALSPVRPRPPLRPGL